MTISGYKELLGLGLDAGSMGDLVSLLPRSEIIQLREEAQLAKLPLVKTMWFDYELQESF